MIGSFSRVNSSFLISTIILVLTYVFSITLAGAFQVWVADKAGDSTAKKLGYLSLNPLDFVSLFGLFMLVVMRLGWSKFIPINVENIDSPHKNLKILGVYLAPTFVHFILSITSIAILIYCYSFRGIGISLYNLPPDYSGLQIAALLLLQGFIYFNIFMGFLEGIIGIVRTILAIGSQKGYAYVEYSEPILIITPLVAIIVLLYVLSTPIIYLIYWIAYLFSSWFGAL